MYGEVMEPCIGVVFLDLEKAYNGAVRELVLGWGPGTGATDEERHRFLEELGVEAADDGVPGDGPELVLAGGGVGGGLADAELGLKFLDLLTRRRNRRWRRRFCGV